MPFREPFFEQVRRVYRDRDLGFARSLPGCPVPGRVGRGGGRWSERRALLRDLGPDEVQLRRHLLEMCDDLERTIRVRAFAESAPAVAQQREALASRCVTRLRSPGRIGATCTGPR